MKVYFMFKPGFDTDENIAYAKANLLTEQNRCKILKEGRTTYTLEGARLHYAEHIGKDFYQGLEDYITSGTVYGMVVDFAGTEEEWKNFRTQKIGATKNPAPGSIRYDLTIGKGKEYDVSLNVAHSSDSEESGKRECEIFEMMLNAND